MYFLWNLNPWAHPTFWHAKDHGSVGTDLHPRYSEMRVCRHWTTTVQHHEEREIFWTNSSYSTWLFAMVRCQLVWNLVIFLFKKCIVWNHRCIRMSWCKISSCMRTGMQLSWMGTWGHSRPKPSTNFGTASGSHEDYECMIIGQHVLSSTHSHPHIFNPFTPSRSQVYLGLTLISSAYCWSIYVTIILR